MMSGDSDSCKTRCSVSYERNGMKFADGTSLEFDAIVLATGWGDFNVNEKNMSGKSTRLILI
jgi:hypothetical protein